MNVHLDPQIAVILTSGATLLTAGFVGYGIYKDKNRQGKIDEIAAYKGIIERLDNDVSDLKSSVEKLQKEADTWKTKYTNLLGKYNASLRKIRALEGRLKKYEKAN
jgi:peptidoglycan hydrolase CwlO-like protein